MGRSGGGKVEDLPFVPRVSRSFRAPCLIVVAGCRGYDEHLLVCSVFVKLIWVAILPANVSGGVCLKLTRLLVKGIGSGRPHAGA
jgi:hypothetical protein